MLFFAGCASSAPPAIQEPPRFVSVSNTLSPAETSNYEELGSVYCYDAPATGTVTDGCRSQMRASAAEKGADLIVIEAPTKAKAYRRKTAPAAKK
jgi:hypothetical protein